jgi:hypothetical protein
VLLAVPDAYKSTGWIVLLFGCFVYGTLAVSVWKSIKTRNWLFLLFPVHCIAYITALFASGTSLGLWTRWTVPVWGSLLISFGYAVGILMPRVLPSGPLRPALARSLLGAFLLAQTGPFLYHGWKSFEPGSYREVGEWLRDHAAPNESVFLEPIGLIGYISKLYVHDYIGLVSPDVAEARRATGSNRWFAEYIRSRVPAYVVLRSKELENNEFSYGGYGDGVFTSGEKEWFNTRYEQVYRTIIGPEPDHFVIFRKLAVRGADVS